MKRVWLVECACGEYDHARELLRRKAAGDLFTERGWHFNGIYWTCPDCKRQRAARTMRQEENHD